MYKKKLCNYKFFCIIYRCEKLQGRLKKKSCVHFLTSISSKKPKTKRNIEVFKTQRGHFIELGDHFVPKLTREPFARDVIIFNKFYVVTISLEKIYY